MTLRAALFPLLLLSAPAALAQDTPAEAPAAAAPAVHTLSVDSGRSVIYVTTKKDGVAAALAHDHVIRATQTAGTVVFDEGDPAKSTISVTVDVASLRVDLASDRQLAGVAGDVPDGDRETVRGNMLAASQLNAAAHPKMTFQSTAITPSGGGQYTVKGNLTIRGVTKAVQFPATIQLTDGELTLKGALGISHTQFGFQPYSAAFGAIANSDQLRLQVLLRAR